MLPRMPTVSDREFCVSVRTVHLGHFVLSCSVVHLQYSLHKDSGAVFVLQTSGYLCLAYPELSVIVFMCKKMYSLMCLYKQFQSFKNKINK